MLKELLTSSKCPAWVFFVPLMPYYAYLALKSLHPTFFTACNPGLFSGGVINELKFELLEQLPAQYLPKTFFASVNDPARKILAKMQSHDIKFPVILKPNIGEKGSGVILVREEANIEDYMQQSRYDVVVQEYLDHPVELGVFYYRIPSTKKYGILSIATKHLPEIIGDGQSTVGQLVERNIMLSRLPRNAHVSNLQVLPKGESLTVDYVAHRNRGAVFRNADFLITPKVVECFKSISDGIKGFDIGRFDIKAKSILDFSQNLDFKILEVNGVGSMPIHVFDKSISTLSMYDAIRRLWKIIHQISRVNRAQGVPCMHYSKLIGEVLSRRDSKMNQKNN